MSANIQHIESDIFAGKKVMIQPPEYFPGLSYLSMMQEADTIILADTFQYSRQSRQNRCRVRSPDGWHWISIPLVGGQHGKPVNQMLIDNRVEWASKHRRALLYNYRSSPYYDYFAPKWESILSSSWNSLGKLTCATITLLAGLLPVNSEILFSSELDHPRARIADFVPIMKDATVLTTPDLEDYYTYLFECTEVHQYREKTYWQNFAGFEHGLSALDALCNLGPEAVHLL